MRTVRTLYTAMMVLLAKATDRELARMVSYLKEENRILPTSSGRAETPQPACYANSRSTTSAPVTSASVRLAPRPSWGYVSWR
jgi:hypothetical protein